MDYAYDYLIVGAGLFGAVFAHEARKQGKRCLVIDKRSHAGGNIYCQDVDGIHVHQYGAHIFHTHSEAVWKYVNRLAEFNRFTNAPLACFQGKIYNLPFNMNTFNRLWGVVTPEEAREKIREQCRKYAHVEPNNLEEQALKLCGEDIYRTLIQGYTEKQWGRPATELPAFIIKRVPFRFTYDNNYFDDPWQGIPVGGYNKLTAALLQDIEFRQDTDYFADREHFDRQAEKILFTGCIDEFFNYEFGRLEYRSLRFEHSRPECADFQGNAVVNYTERDVPFTRIIEHKHFEFGQQPFTVITHEYPQNFTPGSEPYYPVNDRKNTLVLEQYKAKSGLCSRFLMGGRLGQYAYFDMDDTIEAALQLANRELNLNQSSRL